MTDGIQLIGFRQSGNNTKTFKGSGNSKDSSIFHEASIGEIDEAVQLAAVAFEKYRKMPGQLKAAFLDAVAARIDAVRKTLVETASAETALPAARLEMEITRTVNQIKLFSKLLQEGSWVNAIIDKSVENAPVQKPDIRQMQQPVGPIAVFGASNFPFAFSVAGGDTISALAAGCPVIYKAHPGHPATSEIVGKIIIEAAIETAMPEGVFSLLQGITIETGATIVMHPKLKSVAFTGSFAGGKALYDLAAKRPEPIPVYAEMGSVNPVFILPGILAEKGGEIARLLAASNILGAGQFCTNPGLIILENSSASKIFLEEFAGCIKASANTTMLTESIHAGYSKNIGRLSNHEKVKIIARGGGEENNGTRAFMFQVAGSDFLSDHSLMEEVFGPSSIHITIKGTEEALTMARRLTGQLTISVWGTEKDLRENQELIETLELKAGRIIFNSVPTGVEVTAAMMHGGPFPATTDSKFTSVGTQSIYRFTRPVCYQNTPGFLLPAELKDENSLKIRRLVNGTQEN